MILQTQSRGDKKFKEMHTRTHDRMRERKSLTEHESSMRTNPPEPDTQQAAILVCCEIRGLHLTQVSLVFCSQCVVSCVPRDLCVVVRLVMCGISTMK